MPSDDARKRYNELRLLLMKLGDVAGEAAEIAETSGLPGASAALEGIDATVQALRSRITAEDFENDD